MVTFGGGTFYLCCLFVVWGSVTTFYRSSYLPTPLLCILLRDIEVQISITGAGLDHRSLKPLVETRDRDPIRIAANSSRPTLTICCTVIAWNDICSLPTRYARIIVAGQHASRPDFLRLIRLVICIDLVMKTLVDLVNTIMLNPPIGPAKEMNAVKDA